MIGLPPARIHLDLHAHLDAHPDCCIVLPRGHSKTTTVLLRALWLAAKSPMMRVKIVGSSDDEAKKSVKAIRGWLLSAEFSAVFPYVKLDEHVSGTVQLSLLRPKVLRDPTFEAVSIFGRAGGRCDTLIFDDIVDLKNAIQFPAYRQQVIDAVNTVWMPTIDRASSMPHTLIFAGTPYAEGDCVMETQAWHEKRGSLFRRPVSGFTSPWPEAYGEITMREIRERIGPLAYARSYELIPMSKDTQVFAPEWLDAGMYSVLPEHVVSRGRCFAAVDWAFKTKAANDFSALVVGIADEAGHLWVTQVHRSKEQFPDFCRFVADTCRRANVDLIMAEANGPQAGLAQQLRELVEIPVKDAVRMHEKKTRAIEKQGFVESGRLHLLKDHNGLVDRSQEALYAEMTSFPAGKHDDLLDAAIDLMTLAATRLRASSPPTTVRTSLPQFWRLYGRVRQ